jgi:hypothetical protein
MSPHHRFFFSSWLKSSTFSRLLGALLYRLSRAASIAAMSIFRIVIIAFIARLAAARSGPASPPAAHAE